MLDSIIKVRYLTDNSVGGETPPHPEGGDTW